MEISTDKLQAYMLTNNMHNLTKVLRSRSEQGVFSDYPHFYKLVSEGKDIAAEGTVAKEGEPEPYFGELFAQRMTENGEFIISKKPGDFTLYG